MDTCTTTSTAVHGLTDFGTDRKPVRDFLLVNSYSLMSLQYGVC